MPNKNYEAGRRFEWAQKAYWESKGYIVLRTAGSRGFFDLVAIHPPSEEIQFIQCKVVSSSTEADRLTREFDKQPPMQKGKNYIQTLAVHIKGKSEPWYVRVWE